VKEEEHHQEDSEMMMRERTMKNATAVARPVIMLETALQVMEVEEVVEEAEEAEEVTKEIKVTSNVTVAERPAICPETAQTKMMDTVHSVEDREETTTMLNATTAMKWDIFPETAQRVVAEVVEVEPEVAEEEPELRTENATTVVKRVTCLMPAQRTKTENSTNELL